MDDCIVWWGAVQPDGYGVWPSSGGRYHRRRPYAHRVIYEETLGPIPAGLTLDHLCRNRTCVNPSHLEPVTNRENILRGESLSARRARQTECYRGHPLSGENLYSWGGRRYCRKCRSEYKAGRRLSLAVKEAKP